MSRARMRNDERSLIAHLAARLMAEDGVEDYALAKRKAARQAGMPDTRQLPANEEIDAALRDYREIYQAGAHHDTLRGLREKAAGAMRELAAFDPHLTGSVLSGNAGQYADIRLQLYADSAKAVELFLIGRRIPYRTAQSRLHAGDAVRVFPVFVLDEGGTMIELTVLEARDRRGPVRTSPEGKPMDRARLAEVEMLLGGAGPRTLP